MNLLRRILPLLYPLWGLLFTSIVAYGVWQGVSSIGQYLQGLSKELAGASIAAFSAVVVSTLTVVLGRYYERKKELDALYRDKKAEMYDDFLRRIIAMGVEIDNPEEKPVDDTVSFLRDFNRKLLLWSGPEVIEAFLSWKDHLTKTATSPDAKTIFLLEEFLLAVRRDLRHSNRGIRRGLYARAFMREGNLFLAMAKENPSVSLATVALAEEYLQQAKANTAAVQPETS